MYSFENKEKYCLICTCPVWLYFSLLFCAQVYNEFKSANYKSHWNILVFYNHWKIMPDLNKSHEKMSHFV